MNELSKNLKCIRTKSGIEIWVESERAQNLQDILENLKNHFFVAYEDQTINTAEIEGIFTAKTMDEYTRRRNGEWKCQKGEWHTKREKCDCEGSKLCAICKKENGTIRINEGFSCHNCFMAR